MNHPYSEKIRQSFRRIKSLTFHFLYTMKRNPTRIIEIVVWPSFEILLFTLLATSIEKTESTQIKTGLLILSGIIFWDFFSRIVQETISQFLDDANSKNIQNILITPIKHEELLASLSIASFLKMIISSVFLILIVLAIYPTILFMNITLTSFLWIALLIIYGVIISIFGISLILLFGQKVSFVGSFLSTFIQLFTCVFYSREVLIEPLKTISYAVAPSYVFEAMRKYIIFGENSPTNIYISLVITFVTGIIAMFIFKICYKQAKKNGSLTKI